MHTKALCLTNVSPRSSLFREEHEWCCLPSSMELKKLDNNIWSRNTALSTCSMWYMVLFRVCEEVPWQHSNRGATICVSLNDVPWIALMEHKIAWNMNSLSSIFFRGTGICVPRKLFLGDDFWVAPCGSRLWLPHGTRVCHVVVRVDSDYHMAHRCAMW